MKENKYDNENFFIKYSQMERSKKGLQGAGEWHELKKILPDFQDKTVLDLGCGYGWHCKYAIDNGAKYVLGVDISKKMLEVAKSKNNDKKIDYRCIAMEDLSFSKNVFDIIISSNLEKLLLFLFNFITICKYFLKKVLILIIKAHFLYYIYIFYIIVFIFYCHNNKIYG